MTQAQEYPEETYTVHGERRFRGHAPGESFAARFSPEQKERYLELGVITVDGESGGDKPAAKPKKAAKPAEKKEEDHEASAS